MLLGYIVSKTEYNNLDKKGKYLLEMARNREILKKECPRSERLEALMELCCGCVVVAEENLRLNMEFENAALMEEFLTYAEEAEGYDQLLNSLYSTCKRMDKTVFSHPRLQARFKRFFRQVVYRIESAFCDGRELSISSDLSSEISELESNVWFADNGKWDEIKTTAHLKRDPVEFSRQFEEIIDDVDRKLYNMYRNTPRCMGFCFEIWSSRKALLAQQGIEWRTPSEMNPGVMFD